MAVQTVDKVDLERYVGLWYEISKMPNRFQAKCKGDVTARYTRRSDGRIEVINRCRTSKGEMDEARGVARVVDETTNAKLQVSFVGLFGVNFFWGDYCILGLGDEYEFAVVGHPERKYGWILARTPTLDEATLQKAHQVLRSTGYDPASFVSTPQKSE